MDANSTDFNKQLEERFAQLPKVVQDAITSADVEKHLRELAETHKLHLDQWEKLENEVMLALLGFQRAEDLAENIQKEVNVDASTAAQIAADISTIVFVPIRQELERDLSHPDAVAKQETGVDTVRAQVLSAEAHDAAVEAPPMPAPAPAAPAAAPAEAPATGEEASVTPAPAALAASAPAAGGPVTSAPAAAEAAPEPNTPADGAADPAKTAVARAAVPDSYATTASHERKTIAGDPYREQLQ